MSIIRIAWRNVWRNRTRSLVVMSAVALGLLVGLYSTALFKGMSDQRIQAGIELEVGHIQVHHPGFLKNYDPVLFLSAADSIVGGIRQLDGLKGVSSRLVINAMASSAETGAGVKVSGILPDDEKTVSKISEKIIDGVYFPEEGKNPLVIGQKLARKLKVQLRSKVVLTFQDTDGNIVRGAFRVRGIYRTDSDIFDEMNVFVHYNDLRSLGAYPPNSSHEIAVMLGNATQVEEFKDKMKQNWPDADIQSWDELSPELGYLLSAMDQFMYIFLIIILLALGFGIVNTMLMVVLERGKEIGMLMAVGMNRMRIFSMIMLETVFLVFTGAMAGIVPGIVLSKINEVHGFELSQYSDGLRALGYSPVIYTRLEPGMVVNVIILVLLTGILSSVYPARKALKLNPAESLRTE